MSEKKYTNIQVSPKESSEIDITGDITLEAIPAYRAKALKQINNELTIDGFRKGHIPEKVLLDRVGEVYVLEEAAELALKDIAPEIIEKESPNYIGRPNIAITKLAPGNPIGFKITVAVMPEVKLPDFKKIAKEAMSRKEEKVEVTDKDVEDVIESVKKQEAHRAYHAGNAGETDHSHSEEAVKEHTPEFNDEFVKQLGNFTDVADFKAKAKENLLKEKEHRALEKRRGEMLEKLIAETTLKLPQILIDNELSRMFSQFETDIQNIGLKVEDYLKHIKKTPEDLRKEWLPDAEKRAKLNVILEEIAKKENITPEKEAVDIEVKNLTERYKDIDPLRAQAYVEHMFTLEKTIKFLEEQK